MEIQQLRYFLTICRLQSFSKAAEYCFISSQGISMAIRRLEEYLSCRLFERSSKGIALTEHARYLLPIASKIVELMDNCEEYFASGRETDQKLSVIFTRGIVNEFADAPIMEFRDKHPEIYLDLRHGHDLDCEDALDSFEAEIALTAGPVDKTKYDAEFIHSSRYGIVVHMDDPFARRKTVSIQDLEGRPLTVMRERQKTLSVLNAAASAAGVRLNIQARVDDALLTYQYADLKQATGITTGALMTHFAGLNLSFIPFDDPALSWNVYLTALRGHELSPAALMFSQYVRHYRDSKNEAAASERRPIFN